jgi:hypothetical protein
MDKQTAKKFLMLSMIARQSGFELAQGVSNNSVHPRGGTPLTRIIENYYKFDDYDKRTKDYQKKRKSKEKSR